ncbi:NAD(P)/FAD-dependent oxidoreductase [Antarcticibacterium sp. 1MA-6-2]|uniref:NAD(P)/FAD-dependent oxidoreductase n=1 Tax=Antarcticibacterium sp. 1MA-6-2 TaxID=2908210 RepID=UPI001F35E017|nr:NAD(P)/FAD-dependent oxidoreductase [Antarcticibacterium sp. 1MA-6-2]UJH89907.1 NAD(P)/FAD-dependent oxidoreductase [Antarcticibacterium sp. 1MA-6-2]
MKGYDIIIIGGGAAGFFAAINAAEFKPGASILILERGKEVLTKVRISGGGRCNVTHAEFLPAELIKNYPRGEKELRGPFHTFMTGDTIAWFEERGIELKIEEDGRMFPVSDSSETIIDCFLSEVRRHGIRVKTNQPVQDIQKSGDNWVISMGKESYFSEKILIATGSNPKIWKMLEKLGHTITAAVPSLFTFNIRDERIKDLPGISTFADVKVEGEKLESSGPLLITHWGMSGPAILKLSAWGARELHNLNYSFKIIVNWLPAYSSEAILEKLKDLKFEHAKQQISKYSQFELPKRLWQNLVRAAGINETEIWADLNKNQLQSLSFQLCDSRFQVNGKSTFKEEFVTAGGVNLEEVNFKTFESKLQKDLYFAGEVLNIDAITGGFNFQNAWTGAFLAAKAMTE